MDQLFSDWCMMPRKWSSFAKRKTEPLLCQSNTVTEFLCSGYPAYYDGKTERTFSKRTHEHSWADKDSVINNHLDECNSIIVSRQW